MGKASKSKSKVPVGLDKKQLIVAQQSITHFEGPLPDPETLAQYKSLIPGLDEEIIQAWKLETSKRHEIIDKNENRLDRVVNGSHAREILKLLITGSALLATILGGGYLLYRNEYRLGATLLITPFAYGVFSGVLGLKNK